MPKAPPSLADSLCITDEAIVITSVAPPYTIIHTNKAWCNVTGYKYNEVAGKSCSFLQGDGSRGPALEVLHAAIATKQPCKTSVLNYTRDGKPFRNMVNCQLVSGGTHFVATIKGEFVADGSVDALERPQGALERVDRPPVSYVAEHASKRVKRGSQPLLLADVLANTHDPIVICSKDYPHVITHPNGPWLDMCGYTLEEVEGLTNKILTGPETNSEFISDLLDCVRREETSVQTLVNYKKGGVPFVNQVKTMPVYDEAGELAAYMSLLQEIESEMDGTSPLWHLWEPLKQKLQRSGGGSATPAQLEAASLLLQNHEAVLYDATLAGTPLSQPELPRVGVEVRAYADQALREVGRRLLRAEGLLNERLGDDHPAFAAQQAAWRATCTFLSSRLQIEPIPSGRAPDMSEAAGAAMREALLEVASGCALPGC